MANRSVWKGIVAGAVGGLAASFVMNQFQKGWLKIADRSKPEDEIELIHDDPSTVKGADKLYVAFRGEHIPEDKKEKYGNLLHYATGALAGIAYGVLSEFKPRTRAGFGSAFGSVLFVGADEIGVPLAGLSKGPREYPVKTHVYALVSHLVFGSALEATRLGTRKALAKATHERRPLQLKKRTQRAIKAIAKVTHERTPLQLRRRTQRAIKAIAKATHERTPLQLKRRTQRAIKAIAKATHERTPLQLKRRTQRAIKAFAA